MNNYQEKNERNEINAKNTISQINFWHISRFILTLILYKFLYTYMVTPTSHKLAKSFILLLMEYRYQCDTTIKPRRFDTFTNDMNSEVVVIWHDFLESSLSARWVSYTRSAQSVHDLKKQKESQHHSKQIQFEAHSVLLSGQQTQQASSFEALSAVCRCRVQPIQLLW